MPKYNNQYGYFFSKHILLVALCTVLFGSWNSARAYDWNSDYGVNTGVGFHDNYFLDEEDETNTTSFDFGGVASISGMTEISRVGLTLRANNRTFSESSIRDEPTYNLALDTSRSGERLFSNLTVSYDQASTTETELLDSGDNEEGKRKTLSISPGLSYQVDEKNSLGANLSYGDVTYDTDSLTDYTDTALSLSWIFRLDETRNLTTSYVYSRYDPDDPEDPDDDGTTNTNSLNLGYGFSTSEATAYSITVGVTNVDEPQGSTTGGTGSFIVDHQTDERNNFTLSLSKSYEGSAEGDVREEDRISLLWNHGLSDKSQTALSAQGVNSSDRDYYILTAGYNYNYTPEVVLSANYTFQVRSEDEEDTFDVDNATSNTLMFTLSYSSL